MDGSPSHWPLFWFLWKPALHWQMLLTFVWLQTASSPQGLVFFPHMSPLDTTNKDKNLLHTGHQLHFSFHVERPQSPNVFLEGHASVRTYITINIKPSRQKKKKKRAYDNSVVTLGTLLSPLSGTLMFAQVKWRRTYGLCNLAHRSRRHRSRWKGRTAAALGCSAGCCR